MSCEKDVAPYAGTAKVGFESDTISVMLGSSYVRIPLVFEGTSNVWPITFHCAVNADFDGEGYPAKEDVDYIVTSYDINMQKPEDYDEQIANGGKALISGYVEAKFTNKTAQELRFKLDVVDVTAGGQPVPAENGLSFTNKSAVVKAAIDDRARLAGNWVITGELYKGTLDGEGNLTGFEPLSAPTEFPVVVNQSSTKLICKGLFCDWMAHADAFYINVDTDENQISMGMDFNSSYTINISPLPSYNTSLVMVKPDCSIVDQKSTITAKYYSDYSQFVFEDKALMGDNYLGIMTYDMKTGDETGFRKYKLNDKNQVRPFQSGDSEDQMIHLFIKNPVWKKR